MMQVLMSITPGEAVITALLAIMLVRLGKRR